MMTIVVLMLFLVYCAQLVVGPAQDIVNGLVVFDQCDVGFSPGLCRWIRPTLPHCKASPMSTHQWFASPFAVLWTPFLRRLLPLALLRIVSVTVFSFTVLSALLLILSASRFLAPDSPLLVPVPFLFLVHLHGMTLSFLCDRNPLWTRSDVIWKYVFSQSCRPTMFSVPCCCLHSSQVSVCCLF